MAASFRERLAASAERVGSWLCVGLDPDPEQFPDGMNEEDTLEFCLGVVLACEGLACAVKPNAAFFEALGDIGHDALHGLVESLPPEMVCILDGKRNDIGNTARKYAEAAFDGLGVDAVTVTPYLGRDTVEPFARYAEKGVFVLARTSNASAGELQDLKVDGAPFFEHVARRAMAWDQEFHNVGLVAGATYPEELSRLRALCGDGVPFLVPGVGAQGADAGQTIARAADSTGRFAVVNVGRAVLQAGRGEGWQNAVRAAAQRFSRELAAPAARRPATTPRS